MNTFGTHFQTALFTEIGKAPIPQAWVRVWEFRFGVDAIMSGLRNSGSRAWKFEPKANSLAGL